MESTGAASPARPATLRDCVQAVIQGIQEGKILRTFERWYAEDVVMTENGEHAREGKSVNRAYEKAFVHGAEIHSASAQTILVDGDRAAVEWTFDLTPKGGVRTLRRQVALQTWRAGQIVREDFYHA